MKIPKSARKLKINGTVYVSFRVLEDGEITNVEILRSLQPDCDAEVIRLVKSMPNWIPAKSNGKVVPVSYNLPIKFRTN